MLPYFCCAPVTLNWFCTKRAALFFKALIQRLLFFVLNQFEVIRWNIIYFINADADNGAGVKAEGRQRGETLKIVAEVAEFISTAGCWRPHLPTTPFHTTIFCCTQLIKKTLMCDDSRQLGWLKQSLSPLLAPTPLNWEGK